MEKRGGSDGWGVGVVVEEMSVIMYLMALENFHQLCSVDLIISDLVSE